MNIVKHIIEHYILGVKSGGGGGGDTFTGTSDINIGGISEGQSFSNATLSQMMSALLTVEKYPTLVPPSLSFTCSITGLREIGEIIPLITFTAIFNRGAINPQYYSASPYRSGLPNTYLYTGVGLPLSVSSDELINNQTVTNYTVLGGYQQWSAQVSYDAGVQPKTNHNNNYNTPLPAGTTAPVTIGFTGVYPYFGTTVNINEMTKQPLAWHTDIYYQVNMVAETLGDKQKAWFPIAFNPITGVQFYNTFSGQWEWIGGSKVNSLTYWNVSSVQININGANIDYKLYTHNGSTIGARMLRFYTN